MAFMAFGAAGAALFLACFIAFMTFMAFGAMVKNEKLECAKRLTCLNQHAYGYVYTQHQHNIAQHNVT